MKKGSPACVDVVGAAHGIRDWLVLEGVEKGEGMPVSIGEGAHGDLDLGLVFFLCVEGCIEL